jgi:hypothetical protein
VSSSVFHPDIGLVSDAISGAEGGFSSLAVETDNADYGAVLCRFRQLSVRFRVGKVTPTKVGLFVTVWRRSRHGSTEAFPAEESIDVLVISAREGSRFGIFVFPTSALVEHGIASVGGAGGKRGFRLYPPWSAALNPQATRSQSWQCRYFLEIGDGSDVDANRVRHLFDAA